MTTVSQNPVAASLAAAAAKNEQTKFAPLTANGGTNKEEKLGLVFPLKLSRIVYIKRKDNYVKVIPGSNQALVAGQDTDESIKKIGASFRYQDTLRGLTSDEEKRFLSQILGIDATNPNWGKQTKDYWANISKPVPAEEGLKLEIGLIYTNIDDYNEDLRAPKDLNGVIINAKGHPINLNDYIIWRYCLLYSECANDIEDVYKSPKIKFYIYSKDKEIFVKKVSFDNRQKANKLFYERISELDWVAFMLRVSISMDVRTDKKYSVADVMSMSDEEKVVTLEEYLTLNPVRFIELAQDKNLEMKSFIELCISSNKLQRIPNTNTITKDGTILGNTLDAAVAYLLNGTNLELLNALKAQQTLLPS